MLLCTVFLEGLCIIEFHHDMIFASARICLHILCVVFMVNLRNNPLEGEVVLEDLRELCAEIPARTEDVLSDLVQSSIWQWEELYL